MINRFRDGENDSVQLQFTFLRQYLLVINVIYIYIVLYWKVGFMLNNLNKQSGVTFC